jgi:threonine/homoserine/homoserine lactone efflux protein
MLSKSIFVGFLAALGSVFADTFYAAIAGFSVSYVVDFLTGKQFYIRSIGGILLIVLGVTVFYSNAIKQIRNKKISKSKVFGDFISTFLLTLSNPVVLVFFGAVFAGILPDNVELTTHYTYLIVAGIFVGSILWWVALALLVSRFRRYIKLRYLYWINKISGVLIALLGILSIFSLIYLKDFQGIPFQDKLHSPGTGLLQEQKPLPQNDL